MDVINQIIHKLCGMVAFCIWLLVGMAVLAMYLAGPPDTDDPLVDEPVAVVYSFANFLAS